MNAPHLENESESEFLIGFDIQIERETDKNNVHRDQLSNDEDERKRVSLVWPRRI